MGRTRWAEVVGAVVLIAAGLILLLGYAGALPELTSAPLVWAVLLLGGGLAFVAGFLSDREQWWALIVGGGLVGVGLTVLLGGVLHAPGTLAAALLFVCVAGSFAWIYLLDRRSNWWALIPGGSSLALGLVILLSGVAAALAGAVLFLGVGAVFIALYFTEIGGQRHNWWTLIPAGALFSLAAVVILSQYVSGPLGGAALFLGLGVTFGVLYLMRSPTRPLGWAWIPAVSLLGFGLFVFVVAGAPLAARIVWPLILIVAGVVLLLATWVWRR